MLSQVREWLRGDRRAPRHVLVDLTAGYLDEVEAAANLRAHAEQAPYPQAAEVLHRLAAAEDEHARRFGEQMVALGGSIPAATPEVLRGSNHWDRMAANFRRADRKRRRYVEQAIHWDIEYPEVADFLSRIAAEESANRKALEELVVRADTLARD
jgi:acyl-CoA reductase-like NAD-dependent aldehyde dehydrogenase